MKEVEFISPQLRGDLGGGTRPRELDSCRGRGRTTGIEVEQEVALVWEVRDGMAYRIHVFATREEARAAVPAAPARTAGRGPSPSQFGGSDPFAYLPPH